MIKQLFLPLNSKQKSMYMIIPLQPLRLQKTQEQHKDSDLLKYFITVMIKRWSVVCSLSITYILFIVDMLCLHRLPSCSIPVAESCLTEKNCLYIPTIFKNKNPLYGDLMYCHSTVDGASRWVWHIYENTMTRGCYMQRRVFSVPPHSTKGADKGPLCSCMIQTIQLFLCENFITKIIYECIQ